MPDIRARPREEPKRLRKAARIHFWMNPDIRNILTMCRCMCITVSQALPKDAGYESKGL